MLDDVKTRAVTSVTSFRKDIHVARMCVLLNTYVHNFVHEVVAHTRIYMRIYVHTYIYTSYIHTYDIEWPFCGNRRNKETQQVYACMYACMYVCMYVQVYLCAHSL